MLEQPKYRMSSQRGLPPPTGRLGGAVAYSQVGASEAPWFEYGGLGALPPAAYLQSRADVPAAAEPRWTRRPEDPGSSRAGLAHGPGAAHWHPPVEEFAPISPPMRPTDVGSAPQWPGPRTPGPFPLPSISPVQPGSEGSHAAFEDVAASTFPDDPFAYGAPARSDPSTGMPGWGAGPLRRGGRMAMAARPQASEWPPSYGWGSPAGLVRTKSVPLGLQSPHGASIGVQFPGGGGPRPPRTPSESYYEQEARRGWMRDGSAGW